jgi:hypothetical protein
MLSSTGFGGRWCNQKLTRLVGRKLLEVNCVKLRELIHHRGTEDTERAHASELTERSKFKRFASHEFAFETAASIILRGWAVSISFGAATDIRLPPAVYLIEGAVPKSFESLFAPDTG